LADTTVSIDIVPIDENGNVIITTTITTQEITTDAVTSASEE